MTANDAQRLCALRFPGWFPNTPQKIKREAIKEGVLQEALAVIDILLGFGLQVPSFG
jgi:hypothetical protein